MPIFDVGGGVLLEVRTIDDVSLIFSGSVASSSPAVRSIRAGSSNLAGAGITTAFGWKHEPVYDDHLQGRFVDHQLFGEPVVLDVQSTRHPFGRDDYAQLSLPFRTDLQRFAWRGLMGETRAHAQFTARDTGRIALGFDRSFAEIGGTSMELLCVGLGAFALFGMTTTVLNSLGRQWRSLAITAVSLALVVGLNFALVRPLEFGNGLLQATATATSIGIGIGLILSLVEVHRAAGGTAPPMTAGRTVMATAACVLVGRLLPDLSRVMTVLASAAVIALYFGILAVTRELGRSELESIRVILRRRR